MCKCINPNYKSYRVKVQFFSPDKVPTARLECTQVAKTIPEAILKQIQALRVAGYNENEFVIHFVEVQNENSIS